MARSHTTTVAAAAPATATATAAASVELPATAMATVAGAEPAQRARCCQLTFPQTNELFGELRRPCY